MADESALRDASTVRSLSRVDGAASAGADQQPGDGQANGAQAVELSVNASPPSTPSPGSLSPGQPSPDTSLSRPSPSEPLPSDPLPSDPSPSVASPEATIRCNAERAARAAGIDASRMEALTMPERELSFKVPYRGRDGSTRYVRGYRIQHNTVRGPAKGGIRYDARVDRGEVRALAEAMSYKTALAGLPFGGGKGGVAVDPSRLNRAEVESLTRSFVKQLAPIIGPHTDVPAPDAGTGAETMSWIVDEYGRHRDRSLAVVTGKPLSLGGLPGRDEATGRGVALVTRAAAPRAGVGLHEASVAVQGFGSVGSYAAATLAEMGATITAVADADACLFSPEGLDVTAMQQHVSRHGTLAGYAEAGSRAIDHADFVCLPCDVLVPAALEGVIHRGNARDVQAHLVVEGANLPTTPAADDVLERRGITVVPDLLANAGGVAASYVEWEQNVRQTTYDRAETRRRIAATLDRALSDTLRWAQAHRTTLRTAAYALGITRILDADGAGTI